MLQGHILPESYSISILKSERTSLRLYSFSFPPTEDGKKQQTHINFLGYSNYILGATGNKHTVLTKCFAMP